MLPRIAFALIYKNVPVSTIKTLVRKLKSEFKSTLGYCPGRAETQIRTTKLIIDRCYWSQSIKILLDIKIDTYYIVYKLITDHTRNNFKILRAYIDNIIDGSISIF
jgi:hypothetical protein